VLSVISWSEFLNRYRQTEAQIETYVAGLPVWVNVWRGWMFFIFTLAVVFVIWKPEARWLAATMVVSLFAYNVVAMFSGVGRFPSVAFLAFWSPLAVYFARRRRTRTPASRFERLYAWWMTTALATLLVSLSFDTYNVIYSVVKGVP
jgi:hypothetical protein